MPCLPGHRSVRLRPQLILAEVAAVIFALSLIALSKPTVPLWLLAVVLLLMHTILFYRLGRISETVRAAPSPGFIQEIRQAIGGQRD